MGKLGDVFGDDFEKEYKEKENEQGQSLDTIDTEEMAEICWHAVKNEGFDGEEPRFTFDGENATYDVLLMSAPDADMQKFRHSFEDGGVSMGMFHLDELFSCAFNEDLVRLVDKIEEGEYYIVAGQYEEKTEIDSSGEEQTYFNVNPVAGMVPIGRAKQYAEDLDEQMQGSTIEEQAKQQQADAETDTTEDEQDSDESDDIDLGGVDDEPDTPSDEDVVKVFNALSNKKPELLRDIADGDGDALTKVTGVVNNNVEGEADEELVADVFEDNIEPIDGRGEDEEDDNLDLGGLGDDDEDDSQDETVATAGDGGSETTDSTDDSDDEEESVDDWFAD